MGWDRTPITVGLIITTACGLGLSFKSLMSALLG